jgi:hypothetical protein
VAPFDFFCALYLKAVALCTHEESVQLYTNLDLRLVYPQARQYVSDGLDKHVIFTMANATARYNSVSQIAKAFRKHLTRIRNGLGDWEAFCAKCSQSRRRPIFRHLMPRSVRSTRRKVRVNNAFCHYINMSQSTAVGFQSFKLLEFAHNAMSRYFIILPPTDEHIKMTGTARKNVICTFTQLLRECRLVGDTPSHRVRCPLGQSHVFAPPRFIRERLPSYGARAPSIAKSTYKSYLVFRSFRLSSSLRTSALLAKPLAWRSRFAGPLCWHTAIPSKGFTSIAHTQ